MADKLTVGELVYKISGDMDNLKTELKKSEAQVSKLKDSMEKGTKTTSKFADSMKNLAKGLGLLYITKLVVDFGKASIQAYANAQNSAIQYNNAEKNVAGTTKEQIQDLDKYIRLLEDKTSVDDKSIRQGAQILAQDQISIENQKKLLAGIVDLSVANSKANGGEIDVSGTAKAVGRVVSTGDTGILTRQNVVVDPKTAEAIKNTGDEAQRTALIMKVLDDNAKGAGEALGSSLQGTLNRAKDKVEDLQIAIGKGLSVALTVLSNGLSDTVGGFGLTEGGTNKLGVAMVKLVGFVNYLINILKLGSQVVIHMGESLVGVAKISYGFGKDVIGIFSKVRTAIMSIGEAMKDVVTGKFKDAKEALKDGFDFSGAFDNSQKAFAGITESDAKFRESITKTSADIEANKQTMSNAAEVYKAVSDRQDKLAEATASAKEASIKQAQATEESKKQLDSLQSSLVSFIDQSVKVRESLEKDLTASMDKFAQSLKENANDTVSSLAQVAVDAESKIKDLQDQISKASGETDTTDLQKQLKEQQDILAARSGFEERQAARIQAIRDTLTAAGIDANQAGLDDLLKVTSLEDQIAEDKRIASLDEFTRLEEQQSKKLALLVDGLLTETKLTREKIATQKEYETDLTAYLLGEDSKRLKNTESWANATIAKYKDVAESVKGLLSTQASIANIKGSSIAPVAPSTVSQNGTAVNPGNTTTNTNSTVVNAPVTMNGSLLKNLSPKEFSAILGFELNKFIKR